MHLKYTFETMELDDRSVAVPVGPGANDFHGILKLNETAVFILNLLKNEITEEEIVEAMEKEYNVSRDVLAADVHRYVSDFMEKGLLV